MIINTIKKTKPMLFFTFIFLLAFLGGCGTNQGQEKGSEKAAAVKEPIKIGLVDTYTGVLESFAKKTEHGFMMGLDYATGGKNEINGRKIEVLKEDTETNPQVAKQKALKLLDEKKVHFLVGSTSSADTLAIQPLAEEYKKILIVNQAIAPSITGSNWNRYTFRTARNSEQDAITWAIVLGKPGTKIGILGEDYAMGREGVAVFKKKVEEMGAKVVYEEFAPSSTTDFTPYVQKMISAKPEYGTIYWAGANTPFFKMAETLPKAGIKLTLGFLDIDQLKLYKDVTPAIGDCFGIYYYDFNKNQINEWFVKEYQKKYNIPPSYSAQCGFTSAQAIVEALKKTEGDVDPEKLIKAMEGMSFDTVKGKMTIRPEDHQTLQEMYIARMERREGVDWAVPVLLETISPEKCVPSIKNKR